MDLIIQNIRHALNEQSDETIIESSKRFFKEEVKLYGVKTADVSRIGKDYFKTLKDKSKNLVFDICEELWQSEYLEESYIACNWSYYIHNQYVTDDFNIFEKWVSTYLTNWASCDTLCNHSIGTFIEMYPSHLNDLKRWAGSDNRWVKRAAAVSLIIPARRGLFMKEIFELADILHSDRDDMVQKGYGWMLKAASQAHQPEVFDYIMNRKSTMPRTSLRYAIEKMPPELKVRAMAK